jgi:hypothetical protein
MDGREKCLVKEGVRFTVTPPRSMRESAPKLDFQQQPVHLVVIQTYAYASLEFKPGSSYCLTKYLEILCYASIITRGYP